MPDTETYVRHGGLPWKVTDTEQLQSLTNAGATPIGKQEAVEGSKAINDLSYVDQNWGVPGKLGMGLLSGLTVGLGPGALAQAGIVDPGHMAAAQTSPWYTAGDVAGMLAPAVLSGGESLLAYSPAGLVGRLGTASERLAGAVLGDSAGVLGRLAGTPLQMAARGATEGALINLGHTVGDGLIQNKPLAAEAMLASSLDGALFGGLIGGTLGTVASLGSEAVRAAGNYAPKVAEKVGLRTTGLAAKAVGLEGDALEAAESSAGGIKGEVKARGEYLHKGGSSPGESVQKQLQGVRNAAEVDTAVRREVLDELNKHPMAEAPTLRSVVERMKTELVLPEVGTPNAAVKLAAIDSFANDISKATKLGGSGEEVLDWEKLIRSRDQLASRVDSRKPINVLAADSNSVRREILNVLDSEIDAAIRGAEKTVPSLQGLGDKYASSTQGLKLAAEMETDLGKALSRKLQTTEPTISAKDWGAIAFGTALGHPLPALTYTVGKGIGRMAAQKLEPWMQSMAYNRLVGTKAAGATLDAKAKVSSGLKTFFKAAAPAPYKAAQTYRAESKASTYRGNSGGPDRKSYEQMATRVEQLLSENHQTQVKKYTDLLTQQGYGELAQALMQVNQRAVQYALWNMPPRQGAKSMSSLRAMPVPKGLTLEEFGFDRKMKGITQPLSLVEDLQSGKVSRDAVEAAAYVYPEVWGPNGLVANTAAEQIADMKAEGKFLPMDKIVTLSVALNTPLDSTLTDEYIGEVQMALGGGLSSGGASANAPPPNLQPESGSNPGPSGPPIMAGLMTPLQQTTMT